MIEQDSRIYVNSRYAGRAAWPGGSVEITGLAKAGETNAIAVRVFTPGISDGDGPRGIAGGRRLFRVGEA